MPIEYRPTGWSVNPKTDRPVGRGGRIGPVPIGPGSAQALTFTQRGSSIVVTIRNPQADPAEYRAEFAAHHLNIKLEMLPVSPSLVGAVVFMDTSPGANPLSTPLFLRDVLTIQHQLKQEAIKYIQQMPAGTPVCVLAMVFPGKIQFSACHNTMQGMEKAEGHPIQILPEATEVPSGAVHLSELQEQGWSYLKP